MKPVAWQAFRHSFSTLLVANRNDIKTVQHLMRHANSRITLEVYSGAIDDQTRRAQSQVVQQMTSGTLGLSGVAANA